MGVVMLGRRESGEGEDENHRGCCMRSVREAEVAVMEGLSAAGWSCFLVVCR